MRAGKYTIDGRLLRQLTYSMVGNNASFPQLAGLLGCLDRPDADPCRVEVATLIQRLLQGPAVVDEKAASPYLATQSNDTAWPRDPRGYQQAVAADAQRFPITAGGFADTTASAFTPVPSEPPVRAKRRGPSNIVLLNNTRDRISEFGGAFSTRRALGRRARFVAVEGWNHNILSNHDPWADRYLADWLGEGKWPATDTYCPGPAAP